MTENHPETINVSTFKATCLAVLDRVRRTGRPVLITKRGQPLAEVGPPSPQTSAREWIGSMRDTARLNGDLVQSVSDETDWEALQG